MSRIIVVLVLIAAAIAGSAYWVGMETQKSYRAFLREPSLHPGVELTELGYQRGIFSSEAVTRVTPHGANDDSSLTLRHDIHHGILPVTWWYQDRFTPKLSWAVVRTVLGKGAGWVNTLSSLYGDEEPLVIISHINLDGNSDNTINMPPLERSNVAVLQSVIFSGIQGQIRAGRWGSSYQGGIGIDGLLLMTKDNSLFRLNNLRLDMNQYRSRFDLMLGSSNLSANLIELGFSMLGETSVKLAELSASNQTSEEGGLVDSSVDIGIKKLMRNDKNLGEGALRMQVRRLDGATLLKLQHAGADEQGAADDDILNLLQALLQTNPQLLLETLTLSTPQGDLQATAELTLKSPEQMDQLESVSWLQVLDQAQAQVSVAGALLESMLADNFAEQIRAVTQLQGEDMDEKRLAKLAAIQARQQIDQALEVEFIRQDGDVYRAEASFQRGRLLLNGTEIAVPAL